MFKVKYKVQDFAINLPVIFKEEFAFNSQLNQGVDRSENVTAKMLTNGFIC